jgi:mannose-1-phosphate guanylyltransferase/mannose-6-phosphate isomerase
VTAIFPVILCGGAGTRLWPASRPDRPKQFLKLLGAYSSFQETLLRVRELAEARDVIVVTGAAMVEMVREQAGEIGASITVLVEPQARNSAPAVAAAAVHVERLDPDAVMLMLAADHHVGQPAAFREAAQIAAAAAEQGLIVTFGVRPTGPATGFGYIHPGEPVGEGVFRVAAFVEKPDLETARRYVAEGYLWNSGNFAFQATTLLDELRRFEPSVVEGAQAALVDALVDAVVEPGLVRLDATGFMRAASISIDYAVMERTDRAAVVPAAFDWSDLGAWDAIWGASPAGRRRQRGARRRHPGGHSGVLARSTGPFVGVIGVSDLMIVAEPDAVLVCRRDDAQAVKTLVDGLKAKGRDLAHATPTSRRRHGAPAGGGHRSRQCRAAAARHRRGRRASRRQRPGPGRPPARASGRLDRRGAAGTDVAETRVTAVTAVTLLVTTWR